ncbi:MAG: tRNA dimethylallyltransferase [bacterium]|jgi:tRNA dimethylallyltransferase
MKKVIVILGETASGKTKKAVELAKEIQGEIISVDSRQVFRYMDLGTGKDLDEYESIPYHLINVVDPGEKFSVSDFQEQATKALQEITERGNIPILCGGTAHYLKALIEDYQFENDGTDLELTEALEKKTKEELYLELKRINLWEQHHWEQDSKRRMARAIEKATQQKNKVVTENQFTKNYSHKIYITQSDRDELREKIKVRLETRATQGMIDEVRFLYEKKGISFQQLDKYGLEYKWIGQYLQGKIQYQGMIDKLHTEICRFAKRQRTFLRYLIKQGHQLSPIQNQEEWIEEVKSWLTEVH